MLPSPLAGQNNRIGMLVYCRPPRLRAGAILGGADYEMQWWEDCLDALWGFRHRPRRLVFLLDLLGEPATSQRVATRTNDSNSFTDSFTLAASSTAVWPPAATPERT
jgi:hypothetical protein